MFIAALLASLVFVAVLPDAAWIASGRRTLRLVPVPIAVAVVWQAGWFVLLFIRVEDLNVAMPWDYQLICRWIGAVAIAGATLVGALVVVRFAF